MQFGGNLFFMLWREVAKNQGKKSAGTNARMLLITKETMKGKRETSKSENKGAKGGLVGSLEDIPYKRKQTQG